MNIVDPLLIITSSIKTSRLHEAGLLGELLLEEGLLGALDVLGLLAHNTATPLTRDVLVVVEGLLHGLADGVQVLTVGGIDGSDSQAGGSLLTAQLSEAGLGLDNAVGDVLLAAESRHPADELNRVHIVGDHDELGLLGLDQLGDVVDAELDDVRGGGVGRTLTSGRGTRSTISRDIYSKRHSSKLSK